MSYTLNSESRKDYLYISVSGDNSLETVSAYLAEVYDICKQSDCSKVLIVENLQGRGLSTLNIYDLVSKRSPRAAQVMDRVAYVDINPEHTYELMEFAEDVAVNRGLTIRVFASVPEAEAWLLSK